MSNDPLLGRILADRYRILAPLGEGGMGRVYVAEHVNMGRKSAVKVMSPALALSADAIGRFHREAANASRINHPNVAAIYDFGEAEGGVLYLAMEFIEGETLSALLHREGRLPMARAAELLRQAAEALGAAHHLGIVHRDLKPDNIMVARHLDGSDWVKVVDFGIAKTTEASGRGSQTVTTVGVSIGTPDYMSPEQLAGDRLDARTDVYALGVVLFNMLTGDLPYPRLTSKETLVKRLTAPPRTLAEVSPDTAWPPGLQAALDRALAPELVDRFADTAGFGRAVIAAVSEAPLASAEAPTVRVRTREPVARTVPLVATTPLSTSEPSPRRRRGRRPAMLAVAVLGAALVFVALRPRPSGDASLRRAASRLADRAVPGVSTPHGGSTTPVASTLRERSSTPPSATPTSTTAIQAGAPANERSGAPDESDAVAPASSEAAPGPRAASSRGAPPDDEPANVAESSPAPPAPPAATTGLDRATRAQADIVLILLRRGAAALDAGDVRGAEMQLHEAARAGVVLKQRMAGTQAPPELEQQFRDAVGSVVAACVRAKARGVPELASARCETLAQHPSAGARRPEAGQGGFGGGLRARRLRGRQSP